MSKHQFRTETFASRLISLLEVHAVKQAQLAYRLGVSQGTVSAWVHGAAPQPRTARALADTFGVNVDWLLSGEGEKLLPGRPEVIVKGLAVPEASKRSLSEQNIWPKPAGLSDPVTLRELAAMLDEAAAALAKCATVIRDAGGHARGRKRKGRAE